MDTGQWTGDDVNERGCRRVQREEQLSLPKTHVRWTTTCDQLTSIHPHVQHVVVLPVEQHTQHRTLLKVSLQQPTDWPIFLVYADAGHDRAEKLSLFLQCDVILQIEGSKRHGWDWSLPRANFSSLEPCSNSHSSDAFQFHTHFMCTVDPA